VDVHCLSRRPIRAKVLTEQSDEVGNTCWVCIVCEPQGRRLMGLCMLWTSQKTTT
jgi:hypothetical protein